MRTLVPLVLVSVAVGLFLFSPSATMRTLVLSPSNVPFVLLAVVVGLCLFSVIRNAYFHELSRFPGPFWARATPFWELYYFLRGDLHLFVAEAHKKYGPVLRVCPWRLSVSSASSETVRPLHTNTHKTDFIRPFQMGPHHALPTCLDKDEHHQLRKSFGPMYSLSAMRQYEGLLDAVVQNWIRRLNECFAGQDKPVNFVWWSRYLTFDIITMIAFGINGECIDTEDRNGYVETFGPGVITLGVFQRLPTCYKYVLGNSLLRKLLLPNPKVKTGFGPVIKLHEELVDKRMRFGQEPGKKDMLDGFLAARTKDGEPFPRITVLTESRLPLLAGHETVAGAIARVLFDLLTHPTWLARVRSEIDDYIRQTRLARATIIPIDDVRKLTALIAALRESVRLWPSFNVAAVREAPADGLRLPNGDRVHAGTWVETNAWITNRDREFFGDDAEEFKPERWVPTEGDTAVDRARRRQLDVLGLEFGGGSRSCVGKEFSIIECGKALFQLLRHFDVALKPGTGDWGLRSWGFWIGPGYEVLIQPRGDVLEKSL